MENNKEYKKHMRAVERNGFMLKYVPEELRTKELCEIAVAQAGDAIAFVPEELRTKELCDVAVKDFPFALRFIPEELKTKELCEMAVRIAEEGFILEYVPAELKTPEMCLEVVKKSVLNLCWVPEELRTKELCEIALAQGYLADELLEAFVPEEFKEELNTIWNVAMQQLKPKLENDQKFKEIELALESKKKCLLDNAAIKEIEKKITAAKNTKDKAKLRISKLEKRKTNISKKTNNEIEKLEKAKNDYIHTKMQEFQL